MTRAIGFLPKQSTLRALGAHLEKASNPKPSKFAGVKVYYNKDRAILRVMHKDRFPEDFPLTPAQLQGLVNDAVTVLLSYYEVRDRD